MQIHSKLGKASISDLSIMQRSLLFAELASIAYLNKDKAAKYAKQIGFTTSEFYDRDGAQAYRFQNKNDMVIACRGTEPKSTLLQSCYIVNDHWPQIVYFFLEAFVYTTYSFTLNWCCS